MNVWKLSLFYLTRKTDRPAVSQSMLVARALVIGTTKSVCSSSSSSSPASWHSSISVSVFAVDTEIFPSISKRCRLVEISFSCSSQFQHTSGLVESLTDAQSAMAFSLSHTHACLYFKSFFFVVIFFIKIFHRVHTHIQIPLSLFCVRWLFL